MCSIENTLLSSLKVTVFEQSIIILLLLIMMMMTTERIKMPSLFMIFFMQLGFYILIFLGFINQLLFFPKFVAVNKRKKHETLYNRFDELYSHYVYRRVKDCWNHPVCSSPGSEIMLMDRETDDNGWTFKFTGKIRPCINMGSFNYLGLAGESDTAAYEDIIRKYGISMCSTAQTLGVTPLHKKLEKLTSQFLNMEDALCFGMGFATNAFNLPAILTEECLVLSDELNHASMIHGLKLSKATIHIYKHNDMEDLEEKLTTALIGNAKWKKIVIVVEGLYSMDGTILNLPKVIELKNRYKAYLYVDDAHAVGVLGPNGRGVFDHYGCDPSDIDILMGTYSKSFASCGGFIAGKRETVDYLRRNSYNVLYSTTIPAPIALQAIISMETLMEAHSNSDGNSMINRIRSNTHYFRDRMKEIGLVICGDYDSQIVPWILFSISTVSLVVRELKKRGIAAAGVAYPATPLFLARIRFNISLAHTTEQLDKVLNAIEDIADKYGLKNQ